MTEELKPCPFCGGSAHLVDDLITFYAQCDSCTATGAVSSYSTGAANTWNTRALTAAQPAQTERVAEQFEAMHAKGHVWISTIAASKLCRASLPTQPAAQATPEPVGEVFYAADGGDDETGAGYYMKPCVRWIGKAPEAGTKLFTHPAPGVPEIDYQALIHAAWGKHKYAQGTGGCIAFKRGAEWFRGIALAAAAQAKGGGNG